MKRHLRNNKYEPLVDEVQLIDANPQYAHIKYPDGRETTVSLRHLAPTSSAPIIDQTNDIEPSPENAFNKPSYPYKPLTPEKYGLTNTNPENFPNQPPLYQPPPAENLVNDACPINPLLLITPGKDTRRSSRAIRRPLRLIEEDT
ncbi:uncharacterized protein LOC136096010 [Hydra vulgaris]